MSSEDSYQFSVVGFQLPVLQLSVFQFVTDNLKPGKLHTDN